MSSQQITRFKWIINKLTNKTLDEPPETQILSEEFSLIKSRVKFIMKFKPNYEAADSSKRFCSLYINVVDLDGRENLKINYSLWIEDFNGYCVADKKEAAAILSETNREAGYEKFVPHTRLCSSNKSSIPGHQITVCCEIRSDDLFNEIKDLETFDEFKLKFWQFYRAGIDDACTIRVGDAEFKVSKTILTAHSRFFESMFLLDEERQNEYEITDTNLEVVQALIKYVYLGNVEEFVDFVDDLFIAAVKYKFHRLQAECSNLMGSLIEEKNAAICLIMGYEHQDTRLKNYALEFIKREPPHCFLKPVLKSAEWKSLVARDEALSDQILDSIFDKSYIKQGVENVLESVVRFKWTVHDFVYTASFVDPTLMLLSDNFSPHKQNVKFHLKFEPTSRASFGSTTYSSICICFDGLNYDETLHVDYRIWVENSLGARLGEVDGRKCQLTNIVQSIGHPKFVLQNKLYNENFIRNNLVHFFCDISIHEPLNDTLPELPFDEKTRQTMWTLYEEGINDSCTLLVEGRPFKISKTILMPLSKFFTHHFSADGPQTHTIEIKDTTQEAVEALVKYLYLGNDDDLKSRVDELFRLATKFGIGNLQSKCVSLMSSTMNATNAAARLILAFKHKNPRLKEHAVKFVTRRPSSKYLKPVLMSQEWKQFAVKHGELSNEILNELLVDNKE